MVDLTVLGLWLDWTILHVFSSIKNSINFIIFAPVVSVHAVFWTTSALATRNLTKVYTSKLSGSGSLLQSPE